MTANDSFITTSLKIHIDNGDSFYTGFNISTKFLRDKSVREFVDEYYVGKTYTAFNEISRLIKKVDILDVR